MRNKFDIYHQPTDVEYKQIWKECLFIPDTNVLISLYKFPVSTRELLLRIFKKLDSRIWIPYQVGQEFYENRLKVIYDQINEYEIICTTLITSFEEFKKSFDKISAYNPYTDGKLIKEEAEKSIKLIKEKSLISKEKHPEYSSSDDSLLKEIEDIFEGKVGEPYEANELLKNLYLEADSRYNRKIPPGYADAEEKPYPKKYGDFIVWKEIVDKAKSEGKSIIFITDDNKEDWWLKINGKFIGPRYELIKEIYKEAKVKVYFYQSLRFIELSKTFLDIEISTNVISEIERIKEFSKQPENIVTSNISSSQVVGSAENYVTSNIVSSAQDAQQLKGDINQESIVQSSSNDNKTILKPKKKPKRNKK